MVVMSGQLSTMQQLCAVPLQHQLSGSCMACMHACVGGASACRMLYYTWHGECQHSTLLCEGAEEVLASPLRLLLLLAVRLQYVDGASCPAASMDTARAASH